MYLFILLYLACVLFPMCFILFLWIQVSVYSLSFPFSFFTSCKADLLARNSLSLLIWECILFLFLKASHELMTGWRLCSSKVESVRFLPFVSGIVCGAPGALKMQVVFKFVLTFTFLQAFSVCAGSLIVSQGCMECLGPFECPLHVCIASHSARDVQRTVRPFCESPVSRTSLLTLWLALQSAFCPNAD